MKKNLMALMGSRNKAAVPDNRFSTLSEATMTRPISITSRTRVTTALLLAAGTGTRLQPLTLDATKCLTEVGGIPILERLVEHLRTQGFKRLIVVIGHLSEQIQGFLRQHAADMQVDYVVNPDYRTTNNIYSLWLARQQIREPFLLVESDLVFETWMLEDMLQPDKMAASKMLPWMNGTTVELGLRQRVSAFRMGHTQCNDIRQYKTVNLYSLSLHSWNRVEERLSRYIEEGRLGEYYETVFAELVANGTLHFDAVLFDAGRWYEIDTQADLRAAERLFAPQPRAIAGRSLMIIEPA
ncbi:MAG: phosphocholine cytidylyltransferase family protein, partial [Methylococcales bacterium]|nr:phosphocholine cytidylyltransferase family protein [Methylococcales bacterium]